MKKWLLRGVLTAGVVLLGIWGWHLLFPTPEQVVRKELAELAQTASIQPGESQLARAAHAHKLIGFFSPDAEIVIDVPGSSQHTLTGIDDIRQAAMAARASLRSLTVQFIDITVEVAPDRKSAVTRFTAQATLPGENIPEVQELKVGFKKVDSDWLINRAETVRTLR
jgi:hypothetical protein